VADDKASADGVDADVAALVRVVDDGQGGAHLENVPQVLKRADAGKSKSGKLTDLATCGKGSSSRDLGAKCYKSREETEEGRDGTWRRGGSEFGLMTLRNGAQSVRRAKLRAVAQETGSRCPGSTRSAV
jgi:hypothetical protein